MAGDFLLGDQVSVADYYLFVMLQWSGNFGIEIPARLAELHSRLTQRPAVVKATARESSP